MKQFSLFIILCLFNISLANADSVSIAVAGNFTAPMKQIQKQFESITGHRVVASYASSGKLYAQIRNGAPFEIFLSADQTKPISLERSGHVVDGSRFTYAEGAIVLWSADETLIEGSHILSTQNFNHLAIANPKLAPYGAAAAETLKSLNLSEQLMPKVVRAENIAQTYQYVSSGNAELGFVALSQVFKKGKIQAGSSWIVPSDMHSPIKQDAVLLKKGKASQVAKAFLDYLKSDEVAMIIQSYGYRM